MQWIGKTVGGLLGFAAGGPVGSVLGLLFGQGFDRHRAARFGPAGINAVPDALRQFYFEVGFEVMGHVAKADGRVSEAEIRAARRAMDKLGLAPAQTRYAIEHFALGKAGSYPLAGRLAEFGCQIGDRRELARAFLGLQMEVALASGPIGGIKRQLLWRIAGELDIGRAEFARLEAALRVEHLRSAAVGGSGKRWVDADYRLLGVSRKASNGEVKLAYRRLMSRYHPDKLAARSVSAAKAAAATRKTHEIRAAYERIKTERAFH